MPSEDELPPGPRRDLTAAIHDLYRDAGKPSTRDISRAVDNNDLPATASRQTVSDILRGKPSSWKVVESIVCQLAVEAGDRDVNAEVLNIRKYWLAAEESVEPVLPDDRPAVLGPDTEPDAPGRPEVLVRLADVALLRQAIRSLHGPIDREAIALFLGCVLFVPQSADGGFIISATDRHGDWLCVFTSIDRLRAHRHIFRSAWTGRCAEIVGRELVLRVLELPRPIGVLVDPTDGSVYDGTETFPLPSHVLAEITNDLGST